MALLPKQNQCGIGLLELMLSVAIIALILMMGLRYYYVVRNTERVSNALSMIRSVHDAAAQYAQGQPNYLGVSMTVLNQAGLLPQDIKLGSGTNPWSGDITVTPTAVGGLANSSISIALTAVPVAACESMSTVLQAQSISTTCNSNNFIVVFP